MKAKHRFLGYSIKALILVLAAIAAAGPSTTVHAQGGFKIMYNYGLERGDYKDFDLSRPVWEDCRDACAREEACLSFTYTIPIPGPNGRPAHCWLKNIVPRGEGRDWCISGIKLTCNSDSYTISAPATVPAGKRFPIKFTHQGPKRAGDWITIRVPGTRIVPDWMWLKHITGTCELTLMAPGPGNYEVQYITAGDDWPVAARTTVRVE